MGHLSRSARQQIRAAAGSGRPLPARVRARLEASLGGDLGAVRVHTDARADWLARSFGADAFASAQHIFFRAGAYSPDTSRGLFLLGHEAAHTLDGATGSAAERGADLAGMRAVLGVPAACAPRPFPGAELGAVVQLHASWEHRLLGDARTTTLDSIAQRRSGWQDQLRAERDFLWMWHQSPESVTERDIQTRCPWVRTLRLQRSGLLVTYGELNTLPDYMANPGVIDEQPKEILLPILQRVREEGYNRISDMLGGGPFHVDFQGAVSGFWGWSIMDLLLETTAVDNLTWNIGPDHTNHYQALLGRNACHFAPFTWWRWQAFHTIARDLAGRAHRTTDSAERQRLTYQAWMNHGYADHFLQDSFAAGHLVNKTLIMQWFVEWAAGRWYVPVADWEAIQHVTSGNQPDLAAWGLYGPNPGTVRDPQTAEEQPTYRQRLGMTGVRADGGINQDQAYQNYLAFLNSTVVNSASGALHDHYNASSLWVSSADHPAAYQLWGDDTMLNGGDGVAIASDTAHMSQQALLDILAGGSTSVSIDQLRGRMPTMARSQKTGQMTRLADWHRDVKELCDAEIFPAVHYYLLRAKPRLQYISVDMGGARITVSILFAGYGVWNSTVDVTQRAQDAYNRGQTVFLANNDWAGDPSPGNRKYLYLVWRDEDGVTHSGVVGEGDARGITLPRH